MISEINDFEEKHPLINLANDTTVKQVTGFATVAKNLSIDQLFQWYSTEKKFAPRRSSKGKKSYFVGHSGVAEKEHFGKGTKEGAEGRKEEHLAIALFNEIRNTNSGLIDDSDEAIHVLDYQIPLKGKKDDEKIGKIDLLALNSDNRLAVVELKYRPQEGTVSRADTPLRAFLEGLAYCAIIAADFECVCQEAEDKFNRPIEKDAPALIVLANDTYWQSYLRSSAAGAWRLEMDRLATGVKETLNIPVSFLSLSIPDEPVKYENRQPKLIRAPLIERAW
jgi:hypothetical protein